MLGFIQAIIFHTRDPWIAFGPRYIRRVRAALPDGIPAGSLHGKAARPLRVEHRDGVAILHLNGELQKKPAMVGAVLPMTAIVDAVEALQAAAADEAVRWILLHVDVDAGTPMVHALVDAIVEAMMRKPVVAFIHEATGPGYIVAAACSAVIARPTARIGAMLPREFPAAWFERSGPAPELEWPTSDGPEARLSAEWGWRIASEFRVDHKIDEATIAGLCGNEVILGEQAEAAHLVDRLADTADQAVELMEALL